MDGEGSVRERKIKIKKLVWPYHDTLPTLTLSVINFLPPVSRVYIHTDFHSFLIRNFTLDGMRWRHHHHHYQHEGNFTSKKNWIFCREKGKCSHEMQIIWLKCIIITKYILYVYRTSEKLWSVAYPMFKHTHNIINEGMFRY